MGFKTKDSRIGRNSKPQDQLHQEMNLKGLHIESAEASTHFQQLRYSCPFILLRICQLFMVYYVFNNYLGARWDIDCAMYTRSRLEMKRCCASEQRTFETDNFSWGSRLFCPSGVNWRIFKILSRRTITHSNTYFHPCLYTSGSSLWISIHVQWF